LCSITQTGFKKAMSFLFPGTLLSGIYGYVSPSRVVVTWKTKNELHIREMGCVNVGCFKVAQYCAQ
jgi:hypothetical protein